MANSNGKITAPVSMTDVQQVLGNSSNDLGTLCKSSNINRWAKCKPIYAGKIYLDYGASEQIVNHHAGLSLVTADTIANFMNAVISAWNNSNYMYKGDNTMCKYDRPQGGTASPYRLSDFKDYNHHAYLDFNVNGTNISTKFSSSLDLNSKNSDEALPNDSTALTYYQNNMVSTSASRTMLHMLDLVKWANSGGINVSQLKRGILFMPIYNGAPDKNSAKYVYNANIPWSSDSSWKNTLGGTGGARILVVEFYYNPNGTQKFIAIPNFCYTITCSSGFVFYGDVELEPGNSKPYINVISFDLQGSLSSFASLYLLIEAKKAGKNTWETWPLGGNYSASNNMINLKSVGIRSSDDHVSTADSSLIGGYLRVCVKGRKNGTSSETILYRSEELEVDSSCF